MCINTKFEWLLILIFVKKTMIIQQQCENILNSYRAQGGDFLNMQDLQDLLSMKDAVDFVSSTERNEERKNRLIAFSQSI